MFDHMLESSQRDDSSKWSNIDFVEEITQIESIEVWFSKGYILFGSFRVARLGAARKIKWVVILFIPGYTAGLARFDPASPGLSWPGETGSKRGKPTGFLLPLEASHYPWILFKWFVEFTTKTGPFSICVKLAVSWILDIGHSMYCSGLDIQQYIR